MKLAIFISVCTAACLLQAARVNAQRFGDIGGSLSGGFNRAAARAEDAGGSDGTIDSQDWAPMARAWQYALEHRNRQPDLAAPPVPAATAGTLAVQVGPGAATTWSGGTGTTGAPASSGFSSDGAPAPVARPGVITSLPPLGGGQGTMSNTGSSASGADLAAHGFADFFSAVMTGGLGLTDARRPSNRYARGVVRPNSRTFPQRVETGGRLGRQPVGESGVVSHIGLRVGQLHRMPVGEPDLVRRNAAVMPRSERAARPPVGHPTGPYRRAASKPQISHTVQRSVASLNHAGHSTPRRPASSHR